MKTVFFSLSILLLFFWLTPGQNLALAEPDSSSQQNPSASTASKQVSVPADLLSELESSFEDLAQGLASTRDAVASLTKQRDTARQERDTARQEVASLKSSNEQLKSSNEQLESSKQQLTGTTSKLRQQAADLRKEAAKLNDQLTAARDELAGTQQELSGARKELKQVTSEREAWRDQAREYQARLESGEQAYDHLVRLRDELRAAADEFDGLSSRVADVRGELERPAERQALEQRVQVLEQQNAKLASELAVIEDARVAALQKARAAQVELAASSERNDELEHALQALQKKQQSVESRLTSMQQQAEQRQARIESLTRELASFETTQTSWPSQQGRAAEASSQQAASDRDTLQP